MASSVVVSKRVSDVLDWVGLSPCDIQWRIKLWKQIESISSVANIIMCSDLVRITGSRVEGVGMDLLDSDIDFMYCDQSKRVIFNSADWKLLPDTRTYLVDTTDVHPGYCRLIWMQSNLELSHNSAPATFYTRQGPAESLKNCGTPTDHVQCIHTYWPPDAREWIDRSRPSNYPPLHFVQETARRGIHIVATGYKGSEHQDTEYRFSFSFPELDLVHMWPNAALKCYVLLKLLKDAITSQSPHLSHTLSSYHLKTLLFWLTEETGLDHWNVHSLMECLMFSLKVLLCWVERGRISHYFLRSNNMFDMETGTSRQTDLATTLRAMVSQGPLVLLRCETYRNWCAVTNVIWPMQKPFYAARERASLHGYFGGFLAVTCGKIITYLLSAEIHKPIAHIFDIIRKMSECTVQYDDDVSMGIGYLVDVLKGICGTMVLSFLRNNILSNSTSYRLLKLSEQILRGSMGNEFAQLKLANFYYQIGHYMRATEILQPMSGNNHCRLKFQFDHTETTIRSADVQKLAAIDSPFEVFHTFSTTSLVFVLPEIHATPYALKFEIFKPDRCPNTIREESISGLQREAVLDPDVFVYYMQYLCYSRIKKQRHAKVAFNNLRWIVNEKNVMHRETGLNLLGDCFLKRGQLHRATNCFVKSLRVQSKYNVAPIHLAVLIGKAIGHK